MTLVSCSTVKVSSFNAPKLQENRLNKVFWGGSEIIQTPYERFPDNLPELGSVVAMSLALCEIRTFVGNFAAGGAFSDILSADCEKNTTVKDAILEELSEEQLFLPAIKSLPRLFDAAIWCKASINLQNKLMTLVTTLKLEYANSQGAVSLKPNDRAQAVEEFYTLARNAANEVRSDTSVEGAVMEGE